MGKDYQSTSNLAWLHKYSHTVQEKHLKPLAIPLFVSTRAD